MSIEWQIYQAKTIGVDCILLISEILTKEEIESFIKTAKTLKLDVLLEFHDELEIEKIKDVELDYIGINNRNLRTLDTDINHCLTIRDKYHKELNNFKIIAESGFKSTMELENYRSNGIELFLIGESILKENYEKSYLLLLLTSVIAADPELYFIEPKDGETYSKEVAVNFGLKDFGVAPAGYNIPNTGHHHLIINADLPDLTLPIPANENYVHFGLGQTETTLTLEPGHLFFTTTNGELFTYTSRKTIIFKAISIIIE